MVAIYTANTSANLTASLMQTRITGYQDLPGKRVVTWDVSVDQRRPALRQTATCPVQPSPPHPHPQTTHRLLVLMHLPVPAA